MCHPSARTAIERDPKLAEAYTQLAVAIGFRNVYFCEGTNEMRFSVDLGDPLPTCFIPSPARWPSDAPKWARGRREEILPVFKQICIDIGWELHWVEY